MRLTIKVPIVLLAVAVVFTLAILPVQAQQPPENERHMVFAHYMTCFTLTKEFCKQEIELAQRHGIDGFAMNCGGWGTVDAKAGKITPERYVESAESMYEAAKELGTGFKLFISADVTGLSNLPIQMEDMVQRFYDHPNQFRYQGKAVISAWAGGPETFAPAINKIKADGYKVCFVPLVMNGKYAMAWSPESVLRMFEGQPHMDGLFYFACDDSIPGTILQNATTRRMTQHLGKIYMAGNVPSYNSANLRDFHGAEGYGEIWKGIIRDDADWVEIVTWNDYQEDSNLMAYRWKDGVSRDLYDHDESMLDVTSYYSAWYKTGVQPKIAQDKLYYNYRNRSRWQHTAWDPKKNEWIQDDQCPWPVEQIHDDVGDNVYLTTFLTAPAELTVQIGKTTKTFSVPAGIGYAPVPMAPGTPHFTLSRKSGVVIDAIGRKEIIGEPTKENSYYGTRLVNRAWTGAVVAGKGITYPAASVKLTGGAQLAQVAGVAAVKNLEQPDSGLAVPVKGLQTATYCVKVTYSNPSSTEARLTMTSNGVPRSANDYDYYIPVFLPPTGKDKLATTTFFWSLYSGADKLAIQWKAGREWDNRSAEQAQDKGSVLISSVELVKVEPVQMPQVRKSVVPELVSIPGGTFTMGTAKGDPDEAPAHKVTVSPFAIGKYEVTNEDYEKCDPTHKPWRDGFSWRNREPVIYVSWLDGAKYCNWLSTQSGLSPAYDEKTGAVDMKADGFRMPTEAEWEYVASGRGDGRTYPWGNKAPDSTLCHASGNASLAVNGPMSSEPGWGTIVVGSYPAGASRDGVMDMAGSLCEWCSDYYRPYTSEAQTDPCCQISSGGFRTIRGGSWGYYGCSQRVADREFNNGGYGGYIYIGLRIVLPEAGLKKLSH